jgi:hypothetical protein
MELEELKAKLEEARDEERVLLLLCDNAQLNLGAAEDAYRALMSRRDEVNQTAQGLLYEIRRRDHGA